ncbi:sensor histidine kinase [Brevibacillus laterosporus]|uniref:sensor histidine kinase n=1 Tax=Brevibacillus laterosporus TaxID=1465 RepID=UPI00264C56C1|nr:HAMP domain-containing sensor histidine kinase [Brevibacillus laterosporus]MDN9011616.1 HAMP domain-containing sensor histidine kinase [Brevibacillus laterosporus]MDO0942561.1 HAMP domain-containing sensor histidine kinase [Brevibacillus laterosporus]
MNGKFRLGLKGKMSLLLALLLVFVVTCLSVLVLSGIRENQRTMLEQSFTRQVEATNLRVREEYLTEGRMPPDQFMMQSGQRLAVDLGAQSGMAVTLYTVDGSIAGTSLPFQPEADVQDALKFTAQGESAYITEGGQLLFLAPLYNAEQRLGTVQFHALLTEQKAFYVRIRRLFLLAGATVLGVGFLIGYVYVRRQVNVIDLLNRAASQIGQGDYLSAPSVVRKDELGELAQGIYEMSRSISTSVGALHEEKQKLLETVGRLRELEQQQKQFIGNISHELKTPLTSIIAYADLLNMYSDDPALLDDAGRRIHVEAQRLYSLVEKALQLSAMDVYEFETHAKAVPLQLLLEEAVARLQGKADSCRVTIHTSLAAGEVWADPENVMHIILNLLDNAVKYNRPGGQVHLLNYTVASADEAHRMIIEVADTGIGIPEEAVSRIFDPFYTVSRDRSRASGGTGLGLALVRNLAEKQGGTVELAETGSDGSRFKVELPIYTKDKGEARNE